MTGIQEITLSEEKAYICNTILRALPDWFGIESAIVAYVEEVQSMPFFAAFDDDKLVGFIAIKKHNPYTYEVYVMGVLQEYHRHGVGKKLIQFCESFCRDNEAEYLTVKTLDESRENESYEKTRQFYLAMGFRPLEVFPLLWDKENPCLFMAKCLVNEVICNRIYEKRDE